jgi:hypothetical protein
MKNVSINLYTQCELLGSEAIAIEAPTFSLENWLTDGGEVVSLTRRPPFVPQEDTWYSFLLEAESTPGP